MRTLENHLVGVTEDRPHPLSECAHLPFSHLPNADDARYDEGFEAGHSEGFDEGNEDIEGQIDRAKDRADEALEESERLKDGLAQARRREEQLAAEVEALRKKLAA